MPRALGPATMRALRLNTDGRRHPVENALSLTVLGLGLVAFVCGFIVSAHVVASWAGVAGFLVGLVSQYFSATTAERSVNVVGMVMSFVGVLTGVSHGGFLP
ncbi:hypothetical protein [Sphaerisporangium sp. TRM90804]|uniref:hypothetical protein n=1 Tax=Sphaerisporangium sp. TRM90804 TaxID=3031113 RepID=UPI00244D5815|nr:hypothetical protein [Sphaerisporangium sp. TRM90804]MDH2425533.1 hypothetical protein [Sphaerisporangium sp. TRM90804]